MFKTNDHVKPIGNSEDSSFIVEFQNMNPVCNLSFSGIVVSAGCESIWPVGYFTNDWYLPSFELVKADGDK